MTIDTNPHLDAARDEAAHHAKALMSSASGHEAKANELAALCLQTMRMDPSHDASDVDSIISSVIVALTSQRGSL